jgi:hypothetical protein
VTFQQLRASSELHPVPSSPIPQGHICKHYYYILVRVLRLAQTDELLWQEALLKSEASRVHLSALNLEAPKIGESVWRHYTWTWTQLMRIASALMLCFANNAKILCHLRCMNKLDNHVRHARFVVSSRLRARKIRTRRRSSLSQGASLDGSLGAEGWP